MIGKSVAPAARGGMAAEQYPFHHATEVRVAADADRLFAHLDDHSKLAGHMEKPSLMMAGAVMRMETDVLEGKAVGSSIFIKGRVLGLDLSVEEVVTHRVPPLHKAWATRGEPSLLVMGGYRMGFTISPDGGGSRLTVFIDYQLAPAGFAHVLGLLFGKTYAAWCTWRMATDAAAAMARPAPA